MASLIGLKRCHGRTWQGGGIEHVSTTAVRVFLRCVKVSFTGKTPPYSIRADIFVFLLRDWGNVFDTTPAMTFISEMFADLSGSSVFLNTSDAFALKVANAL